jgi:hypothetical protein
LTDEFDRRDMKTAATVAVKIIDIDESDTLNPRNANSYSEFLKEINALKLLSEHKAKNINHILEALPVGKAMWMITEHCGGGSVATLASIQKGSRTLARADNETDEAHDAQWAAGEVDYTNSSRGS